MGSKSSKIQKITPVTVEKIQTNNISSSLMFDALSKPEVSSKIMKHLRIHPNPLNVIYEAPIEMEKSVLIENLSQ
jgi:hypothetical protein